MTPYHALGAILCVLSLISPSMSQKIYNITEECILIEQNEGTSILCVRCPKNYFFDLKDVVCLECPEQFTNCESSTKTECTDLRNECPVERTPPPFLIPTAKDTYTKPPRVLSTTKYYVEEKKQSFGTEEIIIWTVGILGVTITVMVIVLLFVQLKRKYSDSAVYAKGSPLHSNSPSLTPATNV